jgi:integrase
MTLRSARDEATKIRANLVSGHQPQRHTQKRARVSTEKSFSEYATQYIETKNAEWSNEKHIGQWHATIKTYVNPVIGSKLVNEICTSDILKILNPIWLNKTETANRVRGRIEAILSGATVLGLREGANPAAWKNHLENLLPKPGKIRKVQHFAAMPYTEVAALIKELDERDSIAAFALKFLIFNASRTGEVIGARWEEIEFDKSGKLIWSIPSSRMKMRRPHVVPLSKRSIQILKAVGFESRTTGYIFTKSGSPLSNAAMSKLLNRVTSNGTVHGFRSAFRDWAAEETDTSPEVVEMSLAHTIGNKVEAAYRRGNLLEKRRLLLEAWERFIT